MTIMIIICKAVKSNASFFVKYTFNLFIFSIFINRKCLNFNFTSVILIGYSFISEAGHIN